MATGIWSTTAYSGSSFTMTNSGHTAKDTGSSDIVASADSFTTQKVYWEITVNQTSAGACLGVEDTTFSHIGVWEIDNGSLNNGDLGGTIQTATTGSVCCFAFDGSTGLIWFRTNGGNWNNSPTANPATGTGGAVGLPTGLIWNMTILTGTSTGDQYTLNVGDSAFSYTVPSGFAGLISSGGGSSNTQSQTFSPNPTPSIVPASVLFNRMTNTEQLSVLTLVYAASNANVTLWMEQLRLIGSTDITSSATQNVSSALVTASCLTSPRAAVVFAPVGHTQLVTGVAATALAGSPTFTFSTHISGFGNWDITNDGSMTISPNRFTATSTLSTPDYCYSTESQASGTQNYFEITIGTGNTQNMFIGLSEGNGLLDYLMLDCFGNVYTDSATFSSGMTFINGDTLQFAIQQSGQVWIAKNGTGLWNNSIAASPISNTGGYAVISSSKKMVLFNSIGAGASITLNAGLTPFKYQMPANYGAWTSGAAQLTGVVAKASAGTPQFPRTPGGWDKYINTYFPTSNNDLTVTSGPYSATPNNEAIRYSLSTDGINTTTVPGLKSYFEITIGALPTQAIYIGVGVYDVLGLDFFSATVDSQLGQIHAAGVSTAAGLTFTTGDVMQFAFDHYNNSLTYPTLAQIWVRKNGAGNWNGIIGANPASNTGGILAGSPPSSPRKIIFYNNNSGSVVTINTGYQSFVYTPPTGFFPWAAAGQSPAIGVVATTSAGTVTGAVSAFANGVQANTAAGTVSTTSDVNIGVTGVEGDTAAGIVTTTSV